jgi:hypothetical protein
LSTESPNTSCGAAGGAGAGAGTGGGCSATGGGGAAGAAIWAYCRSTNFSPAIATAKVPATTATVFAHSGGCFSQLEPFSLGNPTTSAVYSSSAVAKSNSCSELK